MKVTHFRWLSLSGGVLMVGLLLPIAPRADEAYTGTPYGGQAVPVPGIIQAELYDVASGAANGIAFNYNGAIRAGAQRTTPDCIGLGTFGKGHVSTTGATEDPAQMYVGWTHTAEWLKYTLRREN